MARARAAGNGRLEEALATLIQNQAAFVAQMRKTDRQIAEMERINTERFARIEAILLDHSRILAEHSRILADHTRILEALADAIREKIGFKVPQAPGSPQ
jgi:hypothetical protein